MRIFEAWSFHKFPLAVGNKAWKHAGVGIDLSTGKIEPMHTESDLFFIGLANETIDATSAEKQLDVNLLGEIIVEFFVNDASSILATDLGKLAYFKDDNTLTLTPGGSLAGRIWAVDATRGVGIQKLASGGGNGSGGSFVKTAAVAFVSNDSIVLTDPQTGAIFDVPTTAAASTVTLPASAAEGTQLVFVADGTKNGHTVQYRDATGPVNLTTALTASKRHMVIAAYLNGKWNANAYVSP